MSLELVFAMKHLRVSRAVIVLSLKVKLLEMRWYGRLVRQRRESSLVEMVIL